MHTLFAKIGLFIVVITLFWPKAAFALKPAPSPRRDVLEAAIQIAQDDKADPKVRQVAVAFLQQTMEQEKGQLSETTRVFRFTYVESIVIFSLAHLFALLALAAAISEFVASRGLRRKASSSSQHEVEVSIERLAIKTSSMALLYLVAALAFYFMYVKFVYPVVLVGSTT
jgi:hypothetical protein